MKRRTGTRFLISRAPLGCEWMSHFSNFARSWSKRRGNNKASDTVWRKKNWIINFEKVHRSEHFCRARFTSYACKWQDRRKKVQKPMDKINIVYWVLVSLERIQPHTYSVRTRTSRRIFLWDMWIAWWIFKAKAILDSYVCVWVCSFGKFAYTNGDRARYCATNIYREEIVSLLSKNELCVKWVGEGVGIYGVRSRIFRPRPCGYSLLRMFPIKRKIQWSSLNGLRIYYSVEHRFISNTIKWRFDLKLSRLTSSQEKSEPNS